MAPKAKATKPQPKPPEEAKEYPTIAAKLEAEYLASRPYQVLKDTKGLSGMTKSEKEAYANYIFLETGAWRSWSEALQTEFWKTVKQQNIPEPLPKPGDLGKDRKGRDIGTYTPVEYKAYIQREEELWRFRKESQRFKERREQLKSEQKEDQPSHEIEKERNRRKFIGNLQGKKMGRYEGDPAWDDVVPLPQDDGEGALAQIAYTDEYAEAMGYLRAIMAAKEYSPRVLDLTEHIISLNAAHYTVWLYRASTIFALNSPLDKELAWMNEVALENQKNYQIWHHRQILIDHLYSGMSSDPAAMKSLEDSEIAFMTQMFDEDSKNYHVWSYRQYFVQKFNLFDERSCNLWRLSCEKTLETTPLGLTDFFIVFSNPEYSTVDSRATEYDPKIPAEILDREIEFGKAATFETPQNPSPWNYIRGVLKKGGRKLSTLECFAGEFVKIPEDGTEESVKSSHALDFLADVWSSEGKTEKADEALRLLGDKYDRIRKNYWDWRRGLLKQEKTI